MFFEIVGNISDVEIIAIGKGIRGRRWRKMKGIATIELADATST